MDWLQVIGKPCNKHWKTMDLLKVTGKSWICYKSFKNHGPTTSHWKTMDLLQSLENYGPAASHTKIMKKSMENHGSAVSQWNTMDLLQVIRKPWTCCKSLENNGKVIGKP